MEKLIVYTDRCKSCRICIQNCPRRAISVTTVINEKGYPTIDVDEDKCIHCGICYNVCPDYVFEILEEEGQVNG